MKPNLITLRPMLNFVWLRRTLASWIPYSLEVKEDSLEGFSLLYSGLGDGFYYNQDGLHKSLWGIILPKISFRSLYAISEIATAMSVLDSWS